MNRILAVLFLMVSGFVSRAQESIIAPFAEKIQSIQHQIDSLDGSLDSTVKLLTEKQTQEATDLYIHTITQTLNAILQSNKSILEQKQLLRDYGQYLLKINASNYHLYALFTTELELIERLMSQTNDDGLLELLRSDLLTAVQIVPFFAERDFAKDLLLTCAKYQPSLLLKSFDNFAHLKYAKEVLDRIAEYAPLHLSYYYGSNNSVYKLVQNETTLPHLAMMTKLHRAIGSTSRAYMLMDEIENGRLTAREADGLVRYKDSLFDRLIQLKSRKNILASYSVEDELRYLALLKIREINALHEEGDEIRFAGLDTNDISAVQMYYMLVYGEDEVYTSTFLGMFSRMMERMDSGSTLEFLYSTGMSKYATFIKQCANYNTLDVFLSKMNTWETRRLMQLLVEELRNAENPLSDAVHLLDVYFALRNDQLQAVLANIILEESKSLENSEELKLLYNVILELLALKPQTLETQQIIASFMTVSSETLFSDGTHVQQHFFFEDDDGKYSFLTFRQKFRTEGWKEIEKENYIIIESTSGKKVRMYANKPTAEIVGQRELDELFKANNRYPDIIVHRGHSYYVDVSIDRITPNASVVILGSCGGYNHVNQVLLRSPKTQLVTSKQVGMRVINEELIFGICEHLRNGVEIEWATFWEELSRQFSDNKTARESFADYIPPNKNMGMILIKVYREKLGV